MSEFSHQADCFTSLCCYKHEVFQSPLFKMSQDHPCTCRVKPFCVVFLSGKDLLVNFLLGLRLLVTWRRKNLKRQKCREWEELLCKSEQFTDLFFPPKDFYYTIVFHIFGMLFKLFSQQLWYRL